MQEVFKRILTIPLEIELFVSKQCWNYGNRLKLQKNSPVMFVFLQSREAKGCQLEHICCLRLGTSLQKLSNIFIVPLCFKSSQGAGLSIYS